MHAATRRTLAAALVLWLAWRGGASLYALGHELATRTEGWRLALELTAEQRITRALWGWDQDGGRKPGYSMALVKAITADVPAHATVWIVGVASKKQGQALTPLPHLCFPRRFELARPVEAAAPAEPDYWLVLDPKAEELARATRTKLAAGPDWSLWR